MKMTLPRFDSVEVEIDPNTLIEFPNGLPGFESCKQFKIFHSGDDPLIFWLQSIEDADVVFSVTDPDSLQIFYKMALTAEEQSTLQIDADDEIQIAVILSRQSESNITVRNPIQANVTTPIIINVSKRIALQKLHNSGFSIHPYQPLPEVSQAEAPTVPDFVGVPRMGSVARAELCAA